MKNLFVISEQQTSIYYKRNKETKMVKPKYEVEKRTQTTPFLVENSVFLFENDQSAHEFQTPNRISPDLNVLFVRHFFPQKRHRQRVEQKRESTRVSAVSHSNWRTHWEPMQKIVIKAGNEFYVCGRACDVSNPLQKFQSSPGYLAFFFAFDWLLIGIGILSPPIPFVEDNSNGTLAPRKEKLNTGYTDFSSPTKMWKMHCFFVQTEAVVEQPKQNCVRKEGSYVLKFQLTTISQPHSVVEEEKRKALLLAQTTQIYTGTHLTKKNYININQRSKTVGKHFSFSTFRSTFVCALACSNNILSSNSKLSL